MDRGVLPVGEIGKSLQDIAPTRNLSGKIKEKYGGLKKFLERYLVSVYMFILMKIMPLQR